MSVDGTVNWQELLIMSSNRCQILARWNFNEIDYHVHNCDLILISP